MKIQIKQEIEVDVVKGIKNEGKANEEVESYRQTFEPGEALDVEVFDTTETTWGFEFGNGEVVYLETESFNVIAD